MGTVTAIGIEGMPEIRPGDDVADAILDSLDGQVELRDGDVVVVTHKIVSKAEGRVVRVDPEDSGAHRRVVEAEAAAIVRRRGDLIIARTRHGFICANAGVDRSNVEPGAVVLLPLDPDRSARRILTRLVRRYPVRLAVVVTDTFGRPWRRGLTDVAIGVAGMDPISDHRGQTDAYGNVLAATQIATADEIASAADLAMGKATGIPVAVVRGVEWVRGASSVAETLRPASEDLFR